MTPQEFIRQLIQQSTYQPGVFLGFQFMDCHSAGVDFDGACAELRRLSMRGWVTDVQLIEPDDDHPAAYFLVTAAGREWPTGRP